MLTPTLRAFALRDPPEGAGALGAARRLRPMKHAIKHIHFVVYLVRPTKARGMQEATA